MRRPIQLALVALAPLLFTACASFRFESQEITLRPDPESDALVVEILYHGVHARPDKQDAAPKGAEAIERLGAGRRHFIISDWFLDIDLDAIEPPEEPSELVRRGLEFLTGITVERAGLFVDEHDRLGAYQRIRFEQLAKGLELANDAHSQLVLDLADERDEFIDEHTWNLWQKRARAGEPWFVLAGDTFEYHAPMSPVTAARLLEEFVRECLKHPDNLSLFVGLLAALTELAIEGELAVARFVPGPDGRIHLGIERSNWVYSPALRTALERSHGAIERIESSVARKRLRGE